MWLTNWNNEVIFKADVKDGLLIVSRIMSHSQAANENNSMCNQNKPDQRFDMDTKNDLDSQVQAYSETCSHLTLTEEESVFINSKILLKDTKNCYATNTISQREKTDNYNLMHRRFGHLGPDQLRNVHKVTKLRRPNIIPSEKEICRVCKPTKLRNRTNKTLSSWKESILALFLSMLLGHSCRQ